VESQAAKPTRSQLLFDHAYVSVTIGPSQAVPFHPIRRLWSGTAISKTNETTFTLNENCVYRVSYALRRGHFSSWLGVFEDGHCKGRVTKGDDRGLDVHWMATERLYDSPMTRHVA
jgi:hypothetical protein